MTSDGAQDLEEKTATSTEQNPRWAGHVPGRVCVGEKDLRQK